eukprot:4262307-Alexandrium_andersonii.AAC.1
MGGPVNFVSARGGCSGQRRSCAKCSHSDLACFLVPACRPCDSPPAAALRACEPPRQLGTRAIPPW